MGFSEVPECLIQNGSGQDFLINFFDCSSLFHMARNMCDRFHDRVFMSIHRNNSCWEFGSFECIIPWAVKKLCLWYIWKRILRLKTTAILRFKLFTSCWVTSTVNLDRTLLSVYLMIFVYLAKGPSSWGPKKKLIRVLEVTAYFSMCHVLRRAICLF